MIKITAKNLDVDGIVYTGSESPAALDLPSDDLVRFDHPVEYELRAALISNGALVTGRVETQATCVCVRCLAKVAAVLASDDVCHFFENPLPAQIDLTSDIREDILIGLSDDFVCSEDCAGLCPRCGQNLNEGRCDCVDERPEDDDNDDEDSPWGALDNLKI